MDNFQIIDSLIDGSEIVLIHGKLFLKEKSDETEYDIRGHFDEHEVVQFVEDNKIKYKWADNGDPVI